MVIILPNNYNSAFTGAHNDEYDSRITSLSNQVSNILNLVYPVGSVYISVNSTSPATLFGGTWTQIKGRFLLGVGAGDNNTVTTWGDVYPSSTLNVSVNELGGEPVHSLSVAEMPSHYHQFERQQWYSADTVARTSTGAIYNWRSGEGTGGNTSKAYYGASPTYYGQTGGSEAHNNIPPYLGVYMWKRTA